jgi:hypothetical protein
VADFYAARSGISPPLQWPTFSPPFSAVLSGLIVVAGAHWVGIRALQAVLDILTAYVATGYGIWRSLRGERFQTWEAAGTTR